MCRLNEDAKGKGTGATEMAAVTVFVAVAITDTVLE
jgi:hypothetical protein